MKKFPLALAALIVISLLVVECDFVDSDQSDNHISGLENRIDDIERQVMDLESQLDEALNHISGLETMISELEAQTEKNMRMIDYLEDQVNDILYDLQ